VTRRGASAARRRAIVVDLTCAAASSDRRACVIDTPRFDDGLHMATIPDHLKLCVFRNDEARASAKSN
jgi:hypothetical protein